ncbi:STAS domain-containing protein [Streptomyces sp. NPDC057235]|uniref:STAS domain-containing protein n=1 Tax=Streptomyces sp. NPDC057235 TaxID=3346058 RepID=UPI0036395B0E
MTSAVARSSISTGSGAYLRTLVTSSPTTSTVRSLARSETVRRCTARAVSRKAAARRRASAMQLASPSKAYPARIRYPSGGGWAAPSPSPSRDCTGPGLAFITFHPVRPPARPIPARRGPAGTAVRVWGGLRGGAESSAHAPPRGGTSVRANWGDHERPRQSRPAEPSVRSAPHGRRRPRRRPAREIDPTGRDVLRDALTQHRAGTPPRVVADMSGVSFMDSSGINVLIFAHQHLTDVQGWLRIAAPRKPSTAS